MLARRMLIKLLSYLCPSEKSRIAFYAKFRVSEEEHKIEDLQREVRSIKNILSCISYPEECLRARGVVRWVQMLELEVYKEVARVINSKGMKHWMIYGTLLGAYRHKGFIPWDDDIDIAMEGEEWHKFSEIAEKELNPGICRVIKVPGEIVRICSPSFSPSEAEIPDWMHLRLKGKIAPAVDIYPFYRCNKGTERDKARYLSVAKSIYKIYKSVRELADFNKEIPLVSNGNRMINNPLGEFLVRGFEERDISEPIYFNISDVFPLREMKFEDIRVPVPNRTELCLKMLFGDYLAFADDMHTHVDAKGLCQSDFIKLCEWANAHDVQ